MNRRAWARQFWEYLAHPSQRPAWIACAVAENALSVRGAMCVLEETFQHTLSQDFSTVGPTDAYDGTVGLLLARSVVLAHARALTLAVLRGAERIAIRFPRGNTRSGAAMLEALNAVEFPVTVWPSELRTPVDLLRMHGCQYVIAWGSDPRMDEVRASLGAAGFFALQRVETHGHGEGIELIELPEGLSERTALAHAVARDVALHDQSGCLSPRRVLVHGRELRAWTHSLHQELAQIEKSIPRGTMDASAAMSVLQWQGIAAACATEFLRGATHSVACIPSETALPPTPGWRNITVEPIVAPVVLASSVSCAGTVNGRVPAWLNGETHARICRAGTMQIPAWDGDEDPRVPAVWRREVSSG